MNKKVKVEFEFTEVNENDILKIEDKFFRIIVQDIEGYNKSKHSRTFLRRVNNLEELELINKQ